MNSHQVFLTETMEIVFSGKYKQCVDFLVAKKDHFNYQIIPKQYDGLNEESL